MNVSSRNPGKRINKILSAGSLSRLKSPTVKIIPLSCKRKENMNPAFIWNRTKKMILFPEQEWKVIAAETTSPESVTRQFVLPMAALCGLTNLAGLLIFSDPFSLLHAIFFSLAHFISVFVGYLITVIVLEKITPTFGAISDRAVASRYIAYSLIPYFIATIPSNLFPEALYFMKIFYAYTIYHLWKGMDVMLKTPGNAKISLMVIILLVLFMIIEATYRIVLLIFPV
jgi:hypothetical protein